MIQADNRTNETFKPIIDFVTSTVGFATVTAGATVFLGASGWLGAHIFRLFFTSALPVAHGISTGLWLPASLSLYLLASKINKKGGAVSTTFSVLGGYISSVYAANAVGYPVTFIGPLTSLVCLSIPGAVLVGSIAPIGIALIAITNVGKAFRDFLLQD